MASKAAKIMLMAQNKDIGNSTPKISVGDALAAAFEILVLAFSLAVIFKGLVTEFPDSVEWFWEPILTSMAMAVYMYMRSRGINLEDVIYERTSNDSDK